MSGTRSLRGHGSTLAILLGLVAALAVALLAGRGARTSAAYDPDNPGGDGAQALARVLSDEGVDIDVVRGAPALAGADIDAGTTVLVTAPGLLGRSTIEDLLTRSGGARLVVVGADVGVVDALGVGQLPQEISLGAGRTAGCDDPLVDGLRLEADRALSYAGTGCFGEPDDPASGSLLVRPDAGLTLLGVPDALTNDQILRADNAAVALRLLGQDAHLVWYVPSIADLSAGDGVSLATLIPRWVRPGLWLGSLAVIALILWRARRLGPLASEPLPVVVKAIETTRSRGRLYRKAGDRRHAADALRRAALRSAAERLQLGRNAEVDAVVHAVARHVDRPVEQLTVLLRPDLDAPASDPDLIHLANDLAELDREVRRT